MSQPNPKPTLNALETALLALVPASPGLDRNVLMFRAGQASVRRGWFWPGAAAGSWLALLVLGAAIWLRPAPDPEVRIVTVTVPIPSPPQEVPAPSPSEPRPPSSGLVSADLPETGSWPEGDYLTLRRQVTRWGGEALPNPVSSPLACQPAPLEDLLDLPPEALKEPWFKHLKAVLNPGGDL
jgi:hypothetical protein